MSYYKTCPDCGANLDPGERCDCSGGNRQHIRIRPRGRRRHAS